MMRGASSPFSLGVPFQKPVYRMTGMTWWHALVLLSKPLVKKCVSQWVIMSIGGAPTLVEPSVGPMAGGRRFVVVTYFVTLLIVNAYSNP
jgi:hypothetical protein